jgi:hypothetical protein
LFCCLYEAWLLLRLLPETVRRRKNTGTGIQDPGCKIWDENIFDSVSGIWEINIGFATLLMLNKCKKVWNFQPPFKKVGNLRQQFVIKGLNSVGLRSKGVASSLEGWRQERCSMGNILFSPFVTLKTQLSWVKVREPPSAFRALEAREVL